MKVFTVISMVVLGTMLGPVLQSHAQTSDETPVNDMCPIGKEPIVASAGTVEHDGHPVGVCCPGCKAAFDRWNTERKNEFILLAMADREPGMDVHGQNGPEPTQPETIESAPYLLDTCPITGQPLGSMGDPVVKMFSLPHIAGEREVRFCCAACIETFEADLEQSFADLDEKMIEQQLPYYPLDTCVVMGDSLTDEDGYDIAVNLIYQNRLVRFCCRMCIRDFNEDPQKYLSRLDEAIIEKQREHYPLQACAVIENSALGSMGDPVEKVYGNRLVRFCCASCIKTFEREPTASIQRLDDAWTESEHTPGAGPATPRR